MKTLVSFIFTILFSTITLAATNPDVILGVWWSPDQKSKVEITRKENIYYGKIIAVRPESKDELDKENEDKEKRSQKILGLEILKNFSFRNDVWSNGTIYDPENGKTYRCTMWMDKDVLKVRGYIGISLFGRTAEFHKVSGDSPKTQQEGEPTRSHLDDVSK